MQILPKKHFTIKANFQSFSVLHSDSILLCYKIVFENMHSSWFGWQTTKKQSFNLKSSFTVNIEIAKYKKDNKSALYEVIYLSNIQVVKIEIWKE